MDWEFGISKVKLLYMEWINNKVLLYSTGNYIQYPVTNHNGKEYFKKSARLPFLLRTHPVRSCPPRLTQSELIRGLITFTKALFATT